MIKATQVMRQSDGEPQNAAIVDFGGWGAGGGAEAAVGEGH